MTLVRSRRWARLGLGVSLCLAVMSPPGHAQSLAALARKASPTPDRPTARVLTNDDLQSADPAVPEVQAPQEAGEGASPNAPPAPAADTATPSAIEMPQGVASEPNKAAEYRRAQWVALRARLDRVVSDGTAISARLAALDAGPATPATLQERAMAERQLARLRGDETSLRSELDRLDALARSEDAGRQPQAATGTLGSHTSN